MIDYEKLKIANELAEKHKLSIMYTVILDSGQLMPFINIDDLIAHWTAMREPVECRHEPQPDFVHPGSPGFKKGYVQMCVKCHEEYVECQHESNPHGFLASNPPTFICTKCGEFYR